MGGLPCCNFVDFGAEDEEVQEEVVEDDLFPASLSPSCLAVSIKEGLFGGLGGGEWLFLRLRGGFGGPKMAAISVFFGVEVRPSATVHGYKKNKHLSIYLSLSKYISKSMFFFFFSYSSSKKNSIQMSISIP